MPLIPNLSLYLIQKFDRLALWGNLTILELHFAETQGEGRGWRGFRTLTPTVAKRPGCMVRSPGRSRLSFYSLQMVPATLSLRMALDIVGIAPTSRKAYSSTRPST